MAHFAKLNNDSIVIDVLVINNDVILENGVENELKGKEFLNSIFGQAEWVQTSYNNNFRKQYAGIGYKYDSENDIFIAPQPFNSWALNNNFDWEAPIGYPTDGKTYIWNEQELAWNSYIPAQPFSSWVWNETEWEWQAPISRPTDEQDYRWNEETQSWDLITE